VTTQKEQSIPGSLLGRKD